MIVTAQLFDNPYYYHFHNGRMRSGMLRVQYQLADIGPGIGGFACIPGSRAQTAHAYFQL